MRQLVRVDCRTEVQIHDGSGLIVTYVGRLKNSIEWINQRGEITGNTDGRERHKWMGPNGRVGKYIAWPETHTGTLERWKLNYARDLVLLVQRITIHEGGPEYD